MQLLYCFSVCQGVVLCVVLCSDASTGYDFCFLDLFPACISSVWLSILISHGFVVCFFLFNMLMKKNPFSSVLLGKAL